MDSVIIDVARRNSSAKSFKTRLRLHSGDGLEDLEYFDSPKSFSNSDCKKYLEDTKSSADRLAPLTRFLESHLGRPWDKVYSAICRASDRRSLRGFHLFEGHLQYLVRRSVVKLGDEILGNHGRLYPGLFYVCPETGNLCQVPRYNYAAIAAHNDAQLPIAVIEISSQRKWQNTNGIWYEVHCEYHIPSTLRYSYYDRGLTVNVYWKESDSDLCQEISRRQLCSKELRLVEKILAAPRVRYNKKLHGNWLKVKAEKIRSYLSYGSKEKVTEKFFVAFALPPAFCKLFEKPRKQNCS